MSAFDFISLADRLLVDDSIKVRKQAATMLRQQQAEIEALKKQLARADKVYDFDNPLLDKAQEK